LLPWPAGNISIQQRKERSMRVKLKPVSEQVIVITGASSGIGLATARAAAKAGAKVVLAARNAEALFNIEQEIRAAGGEARHVPTDVTKREDVEALASSALDFYGKFDTWVNDAGVGIFGKLAEISDEDHRQLFDTNFWGLVNGTLVAARHLKELGGGAIVNLGSVVSDIGFPVQGMYSASKHAVKGFTDAFRMELQEEGAPIAVSLIKPAAIDTPFTLHARNYLDGKPDLPPPVYTPEDVAAAILHAAGHGRRDYFVGGAGKVMSGLNKLLPDLVDWFGANVVTKQSRSTEPSGRDDGGSLRTPTADGQTRGDSDRLVRASAYTAASVNPMLTGAALAAIGIGVVGVLTRSNQRNQS
jgi:short-subunit dehydrogenase